LPLAAIRQRLHSATRLLLLSHVRPDGDAVGSLLGLGLALQAVGKEVQMVLVDGVPGTFRHLQGSEQIVKRPFGEFDLFIALDSADFQRPGEIMARLGPVDINIDHHITNDGYGKLNLIDPQAVATSEILACHMADFNLPLIKPVADALLTGIITDTIGFRTNNMTPRALRVAADLMEAGADLTALYHLALVRQSFEAARLWGKGLNKLERDGNIVWTKLTLDDRRSIGYPGRDDADLINVLSSVDDARVAIIFVQQSENLVKISWRGQLEVDVSKAAAYFGGGGHQAAAGAEVAGSLDEVEKKVLRVTKDLLGGER
jgi:bifunctional oligoribonuclease and PAP phosphatase NrnA